MKSDETDVKVIEQQLLQTEAMRKLAEKLGDTEALVIADMNSPESKEQLRRIDDLAQEYYEQYKATGILPETDSTETAAITAAASEDREYGGDYIYSVNTGDAVIALSTVGIVETETRLATRLVTLGALAQVDGPLPVADVICLVVGISLLWHYTANKLSANSTAVSNQIGTYYGAQAKTNAQKVTIGAATITAQIKQGYNHFAATRNTVVPGGIFLGNALTFAVASDRLKNNGDVWSIYSSTAQALAANISFGSSAYADPAHTSGGMFMNRPHWHARVLGVKVGGHSFW